MRKYVLPVLTSIYFVLFLVTLILCLCLWYLGPLIGWGEVRPLDSMLVRLIGVMVLILIFAVTSIIIVWRRSKRDKDMAEDIAEAATDDADDTMVAAELKELRGKFKEAVTALRKSKRGRKHLYELPWYVMIGPPGAGKTTAIVNSGLQFPLAEKLGKAAIGGVGGTRNCDWWFTNEAVLIDTAGRYTTQESDAEADNAAWLGFLNLLKKYRPRQPVNGAFVAISLSDLSLQDELTQKAHAQAVRHRLNELRQKLGVRFPVYVLFTKADLIAGFTEFFDNLGKDDREQVWGFTLPIETSKSKEGPMAAFDGQFAGLLGQLNAQSLERMQTETDPQRRALIAGFPQQAATMRRTAREFLAEIFEDNAFDTRQMLRGVYFTSGTQEGTPIDRLMVSMAQTFGIGRQAIGSGEGTGRSFFLTRLFEDVVFPEAGLVSADDKVERRYRWARRAAIAATILIALGTGALWVRSYLGNTELIAQSEDEVGRYQAAAATLPPSPIGDTDLPPVVDALNVLRDMPGNPTINEPDPARELTYGLYQGDVIGTQAAQTYRAALNQRFLPRLLLRLEEQMSANVNNPDTLYEALKIYLMLGSQGPLNTELVKEWMTAEWESTYSGVRRKDFRDDLHDHLDALLGAPMDEVTLNGPLVDQVQDILTRMPLAQRVYTGIINSTKVTSLPKWRITEAGGPAVTRALVRSSGRPLNDGVEGIYTYKGFNQVFLKEALSVTERVQRESWVLGERGGLVETQGALIQLTRDVLDLYYNDFIARYDAILADIDIIPMESLNHAVEVTNVLSGPVSPIRNLLTEISQESRLSEDRAKVDSETFTSDTRVQNIGESALGLNYQAEVLLEVLVESTGVNGQPGKLPGEYVEERFDWLHKLVERPEGQPSQLDQLLDVLSQVYTELNKMSISGVTSAEGGTQALVQFQELASRAGGPVPRWASQIVSGSSGIAADGTRASMNARWQANILPVCEKALSNRYPFDRRAQAEVPLQDFTRLFAPGGLIDAFFDENMLKYVDTRTRPWTWKKVNDVDLGISQSVLQQMQYAAEIRDAFFNGNLNPNVPFQITPEALDENAKRVILEIDGQSVAYKHKMAPTPVAITWPGSISMARITFEKAKRNIENQVSREGPWAWFRLLNSAEVRATNSSDKLRVIFKVGGRLAIFDMRSGSVSNPFNLAALSKFSCPKSL